MTIKHLVISGGGPSGFVAYGAIKHLCEQNVIEISKLETLYTCSIGSIIGVVVTLGYQWKWLDDYFVKRPFSKLLEIEPLNILDAFNNKGIFGMEVIEKLMKPLLTAKNLSENITLQEYYDYNKTEIHIITTDLNKHPPLSIDISYKTHPELSLVKALYMSSSYPFLFKPLCENNSCYTDGGFLNNYPLKNCIQNIKENNNGKIDLDEIIAFKKIKEDTETTISDNTNIFEYGITILRKLHFVVLAQCEEGQQDIKNTIYCVVKNEKGIESWLNIFSTEEGRSNIIHDGEIFAKNFIEKHLKIA